MRGILLSEKKMSSNKTINTAMATVSCFGTALTFADLEKSLSDKAKMAWENRRFGCDTGWKAVRLSGETILALDEKRDLRNAYAFANETAFSDWLEFIVDWDSWFSE